MGPEATIQLYQTIVKLTPATRDQEHLPLLIYNLPQIPDRTRALIDHGENPLPYLVHAGRTLQEGGARFIVIPCNTSHAFLPGLQKELRIPIVNMIEETVVHIKKRHPSVRRVGLLATTGTVRMRIYQDALERNGLETIVPHADIQEQAVMQSIYGPSGIKAGFVGLGPRRLLLKAGNHLVSKGAEALILGCTEIPLVLTKQRFTVPVINPTEILAARAVSLSMQDANIRQDNGMEFVFTGRE